MNKAVLRERHIKIRRGISPSDSEAWNRQICDALLAAIDWNTVRRMHTYTSIHSLNEVRTAEIINHVAASHPSVQLSTVHSSRNAPQPAGTFDLIVVPLLAFDDDLHRLGYGGGWYDRFLAAQPDAFKIGLAYDIQRSGSMIPVELHDIPLDAIVTESGMITK